MVKIDITLNTECGNCWNIFLGALKIQFPEFAMYQNNEFYFTENVDVQTWIDDFSCSLGESLVYTSTENELKIVNKTQDPTIKENLINTIWVNKTSGEIFTCKDSTTDKNIWIGTKTGKIIQPVLPVDAFDILGDKSSLAFYKFNKNLYDVGGKYNAKDDGIKYRDGVNGECIYSNRRGSVKIQDLPVLTEMSLAGWINWNGKNGQMLYGFDTFDIFTNNNILGFNTSNGDITGFDFKNYKNKWVYLVVNFKNNQLGDIYLEGVKQTLDKTYGTFESEYAVVTQELSVFGWNKGTSYRDFGYLDRLRVFNRDLTDLEVSSLTQAESKYKG